MKKILIFTIFLILGFIYLNAAPLRIIVVGDNRPEGEEKLISPVYEKLIRDINLLNPDVVVNTGDMILGYTDDTLKIKREWEEFLDITNRLESPCYFTVGNHDVYDSISLEFYKRYVNQKTYYVAKVSDKVYFIFLNTEEFFGDDSLSLKQREFLDSTLTSLDNNSVAFIFLHRPLWKYERYGVGFWHQYIDPILEKHKDKVKAVIAGHMHNYQYENRNGIDYYISGGGGGPLREAEEFGAFYHILYITIKDDNSMDLIVLKEEGMLSKDDIKPGAMDMWYNLRRTVYAIPVYNNKDIKFYVRNVLDSSITAKYLLEQNGVPLTDTETIHLLRSHSDTVCFRKKMPKTFYSTERPYIHIIYNTPYGIMDYKKDLAWSPRLKNGSVIKLENDRFLVKGNPTNKQGIFKIYETDDSVVIEIRENDYNGKKLGDWYNTDGVLISLGKEENGKRKYIGTLYISELFDNNVNYLHFRDKEIKSAINVITDKVGENTMLYTVFIPKNIAKRLLIDFAMVDTNNGENITWWDYTGNTLVYKNSAYMAYYDIR